MTDDQTASSEPYILFELAGTTYAVRTQEVKHMELVEQITPVPTAPGFVEGVVFSRGQVIPAINLRLRFGFPRQEHTVRSRLIVVEASGRTVGLLVDAAREFRSIPAAAIQPPNESISGLSGEYLKGIALVNERLILVLDLKEVLTFAGNQETAAEALASGRPQSPPTYEPQDRLQESRGFPAGT
ncbi:MAG TPA: chemotaxis protein CheW [Verrucomicrobiae bacterium]|nr:chemotaxis protein CheW [Verrucomicrobiae bacterium]